MKSHVVVFLVNKIWSSRYAFLQTGDRMVCRQLEVIFLLRASEEYRIEL